MESSAQIRSADLVEVRRESKSDLVRQVFENGPRYLHSRQVDMRFRAETVKAFAGELVWQKLLDVGCGDGTISLQLMTNNSHLTLLDLSANMVAIAKANIPQDVVSNVELRNENFIESTFDSDSFDLIISVGVMAHVDSPDEFLCKLQSLLRPGGRLIIEFTDSRHIVGRLGRLWGWIRERVAPPMYTTNRLSYTIVKRLFERHRLKQLVAFRYARIPMPAIDRLLSREMQYKITRRVFGTCKNNRNAWLGNEYICLLTNDEAIQTGIETALQLRN